MIGERRPRLTIVIDEVAALRQLSLLGEPDPLAFARAVETAGADGICARLRADRSAVQDRDLAALGAAGLKSWALHVAPQHTLVGAALASGVRRCCFVPESRHEHAAGGGLDVAGLRAPLELACRDLRSAGVEIGAFVDPLASQIGACAALGLDAVEINCSAFALAHGERAIGRRLEAIREAAAFAKRARLKVFARGALDRNNVAPIAAIAAVDEIRVGHAVVAECLFRGIDDCLAAWLSVLDGVKRL